MKKKNHRIASLLISMLFVLLFSSSVLAAPAKVTSLKATTGRQTITLTWKKVSNVSGYAVYRVNANGSSTLIKKTTGTTLTINNCSFGTKYRFKVRAYDKKGKYGAYSSTVSITTASPTAAAPKNFQLEYKGDKSAYFKWSVTSGASGYVIEAYNSSKKAYEAKKIITSGTTNKALVRGLSTGSTKFRIFSYRTQNGKKVYSKPSSAVTVDIISLSGEVKSIRVPYYVVQTTKKTTATDTKKNQTISLNKGTKLLVTSKNLNSSATLSGYLTSGTPIKIKSGSVKYIGLDGTSSTDYSTAAKESFVNKRGLSSSTKYLIWVSQSRYKVNIFTGSKGKWKLVRSSPCCIGKWNTRTAQGLRKILKKGSYRYGGPMVYFSTGEGTPAEPAGCAFHNQVDSDMSKAVSNGCVRMYLSDLHWLNNHCDIGTTVLIF